MTRKLEDRLYNFSLSVIFLLRGLPDDIELRGIKSQLLSAATSIGANYQEAQAASSRADFKNKVNVALKEARETQYWLRLIKGMDRCNDDALRSLLQESKEITLILGSIASKVVVKKK